jgi:hypothetical protein
MSFASDLQSVTRTGDAQMINGRTRVQAIYFVSTGSAGYIRLYDGTDSSPDPEMVVASPASVGATDLILPDAGILFKQGVYMDLNNVTSVTLFFYGGAKVDVDAPVAISGVSGSASVNSVIIPNDSVVLDGLNSLGIVGEVTVDTP